MKLPSLLVLSFLLAAPLLSAAAEPEASLSNTSKWLIFTAGGVFAWMLLGPLRQKP